MTWFARVLLFLLLIGGVVLVGSAALTFLYKDKIQQAVLQSLAKDLNAKIIVGYLDISFLKSWPNIEVELADVQVSLPPKVARKHHFSAKPFFVCKKWYLIFDIISFIRGKYQIKNLLFDAPEVVIQQNKQGLWNVELAIKNYLQPDTTRPPTPIRLALRKLKARQAQVVVQTPTSNIQCQNMDIVLAGSFTENLFDLESTISTQIQQLKLGKYSYLIGKKIDITTTLFVDSQKKLYEVKKATVQIGQLPIHLAGNFRIEELGINFNLSYGSHEATITEFLSLMPEYISSQVNDYQASGKFQTEGYLLGYWGKSHLPEFKLMVELSGGELTTDEKLGKISKLNGKSIIVYSGDEPEKAYWEIEKLHGFWGKDSFAVKFIYHDFLNPLILLDAHGKLDIAQLKGLLPNFRPDDSISGTIDFSLVTQGMLSDFRIGKYHKTNTQGTLVCRKLRYETDQLSNPIRDLNLELTFSNEKLHIDRCIGTIGNTDFQLLGFLHNPIPYFFDTTALLSGKIVLQSSHFHLADFLSRTTPSSDKADTSKVSVIFPKNVSLALKTEFERFTIADVSGSAWVGEVRLANNCLYLDTLRFQVFDGKASSNGVLYLNHNQELLVACHAQFSKITLKQLFKSMPEISSVISPANYLDGSVSLEVALQAQLKPDFSMLLPTLVASGTLEWHQGSLIGYPTLHKLGGFVKLAKLKDLVFDQARASFSIDNEVFKLGELDILANKTWKVQASGSHTFSQQLNYRVKLFLPKNSWTERDPEVNEWIDTSPATNENTALLIRVTGTAENPKFLLDTQAIKQQIQTGFKKEKEEIQQAFQQEKEIIFGKQSTENIEDWIEETPKAKKKHPEKQRATKGNK